MKDRLSGMKNLLWAAGILLVLAALLVGLVFAMSTRYQGERDSGTLVLGAEQKQTRKAKAESAAVDNAAASGTLNELPSTPKSGLDAVFGMTFLCDRTVAGLRDYSNNYAADASAQIWMPEAPGQLTAVDAADTPIVFVDGSQITPANAAMVARPNTVVIYLGGDDLFNETEESFMEGYTLLIESIRNSSPNTQIICCSLASVGTNYSRTDELTPDMIANANSWIRRICIETGAWYADLASVLNNEEGYMRDEFFAADGRGLNAAGISQIVDYFRFHGI